MESLDSAMNSATAFDDCLRRLQERSLQMANLIEDMIEEACEAVFNLDSAAAEQVIRRDRGIDAEEVAIEAEVIRLLAEYHPVGCDLRLLCTILKVNSDLERVADCAVNIAERASHLDRRELSGLREVHEMLSPVVKRMVHHAVQSYVTQDANAASAVFAQEHAADAFYSHIVKTIVAEDSVSPDTLAAYLDLLSVAKNLERIADHATNIAENVIFLSSGRIVRHQMRSAAE